MRRWQEARIRKRLRSFRKPNHDIPLRVAELEREGSSLLDALRKIVLDPKAGQVTRGHAGRLLALAHPAEPRELLIRLLLEETEHRDLYETALAIESLNDPDSVDPLIPILLHDPNEHRRQAAARALGWIRKRGNRAAIALGRSLADTSQPRTIRAEAAEALAYQDCLPARDILIAAMSDPDVDVRFWATFGLGGVRPERRDPVIIEAFNNKLDDHEGPEGWWSVGREAFAMLLHGDHEHQQRVETEAERILADPTSTPEDRRWAEHYGSKG